MVFGLDPLFQDLPGKTCRQFGALGREFCLGIIACRRDFFQSLLMLLFRGSLGRSHNPLADTVCLLFGICKYLTNLLFRIGQLLLRLVQEFFGVGVRSLGVVDLVKHRLLTGIESFGNRSESKLPENRQQQKENNQSPEGKVSPPRLQRIETPPFGFLFGHQHGGTRKESNEGKRGNGQSLRKRSGQTKYVAHLFNPNCFLTKDTEQADDQSEERRPFDKSGGNDHRAVDRTRSFGLAGHAFDSRSTDPADAERGADNRQTGGQTVEVKDRTGLGGGFGGGFLGKRGHRSQNEGEQGRDGKDFEEFVHGTLLKNMVGKMKWYFPEKPIF